MEIITGAAKGADQLGEKWAAANWYAVWRFHSDKKKGKVEDFTNNQEMVDYVGSKGFCVAFWNGSSPGTKDMIARCKKAGIRVKIVYYKEEE